MKRIEDECVDCARIGLPCFGSSCPNRNVVRYYCDRCKDEEYPLYHYDGEEVCAKCLLSEFEIVEGSEL